MYIFSDVIDSVCNCNFYDVLQTVNMRPCRGYWWLFLVDLVLLRLDVGECSWSGLALAFSYVSDVIATVKMLFDFIGAVWIPEFYDDIYTVFISIFHDFIRTVMNS